MPHIALDNKFREAALKHFGVIFVVLGIILNPFVLAKLLSPDGNLQFQNKVIIWIGDAALIGLGGVLAMIRKNIRMQKNLVTSLITISLCIVFSETVLSIFFQNEEVLKLLQPNWHGTGSYRLIPKLNIATRNGTVIQTNTFGMRWKEVSIEKQEQLKRIVFVGDSFTFGESADRVENSFVGVFDSHLDHEKYEALNFGVPGYGLDDMELLLQEEILKFKPSFLFLMFFNGNDFRDTYLGLDKFDVSDGVGKWNKRKIETLIPRIYRKQTIVQRLTDNSALYALLKKVINLIRPENKVVAARPLVSEFHVDNNFTTYTFWSQKSYPEVALQAKDKSLKC